MNDDSATKQVHEEIINAVGRSNVPYVQSLVEIQLIMLGYDASQEAIIAITDRLMGVVADFARVGWNRLCSHESIEIDDVPTPHSMLEDRIRKECKNYINEQRSLPEQE